MEQGIDAVAADRIDRRVRRRQGPAEGICLEDYEVGIFPKEGGERLPAGGVMERVVGIGQDVKIVGDRLTVGPAQQGDDVGLAGKPADDARARVTCNETGPRQSALDPVQVVDRDMPAVAEPAVVRIYPAESVGETRAAGLRYVKKTQRPLSAHIAPYRTVRHAVGP